ncbi:hypothetical protein MKEN_00492000 [Mycena kentingensis (nom. inval.)]|nr:hypothetical protein MKEN_00492000 [Mycena kentingensis (nom. inval.)]
MHGASTPSSSSSPIDVVVLATETMLFVCLCILSAWGIYVGIARDALQGWRNPAYFGLAALWVTCAAHWIVTVIHSAHVLKGSHPERAAFDAHLTNVTAKILAMVSVVIGDAILTHRLWIIWDRNRYVVVPPVVTWLCFIGTALSGMTKLCRDDSAFAQPYRTTAGWVMNTLIIIYCTVFIIGRLWRREVFRRITSVFIESAAILAVFNVFYGIALKCPSAHYLLPIPENLTPHIVCLANMLIYLRVVFGRSATSESGSMSDIVMTNPASIVEVSLGTPRGEEEVK